MSWTVILEDEKREPITILESELSIDEYFDLSRFILIKYLNKYGDTIFNSVQMNDVILDLQNLQQLINDPIVEEIIILARKCQLINHTYLTFYGD